MATSGRATESQVRFGVFRNVTDEYGRIVVGNSQEYTLFFKYAGLKNAKVTEIVVGQRVAFLERPEIKNKGYRKVWRPLVEKAVLMKMNNDEEYRVDVIQEIPLSVIKKTGSIRYTEEGAKKVLTLRPILRGRGRSKRRRLAQGMSDGTATATSSNSEASPPASPASSRSGSPANLASVSPVHLTKSVANVGGSDSLVDGASIVGSVNLSSGNLTNSGTPADVTNTSQPCSPIVPPLSLPPPLSFTSTPPSGLLAAAPTPPPSPKSPSPPLRMASSCRFSRSPTAMTGLLSKANVSNVSPASTALLSKANASNVSPASSVPASRPLFPELTIPAATWQAPPSMWNAKPNVWHSLSRISDRIDLNKCCQDIATEAKPESNTFFSKMLDFDWDTSMPVLESNSPLSQACDLRQHPNSAFSAFAKCEAADEDVIMRGYHPLFAALPGPLVAL